MTTNELDPKTVERCAEWLRGHPEVSVSLEYAAERMAEALLQQPKAPTLREAAEALFTFPVGCL